MTPFARLERDTATARSYLYAAPILEDVMHGRFDLDTYIRFLTNAFHHVRHTVPLMMACGARLPDRLRWMQPLLRSYIEEEAGHEDWILADLAACGVDPAVVASSRPGFEVELMVSFVYDYINRHSAVGFFGMVFVLEGTSTQLATETARVAQAKLCLPDAAFTYLRSHGELDQSHVQFFQNLVNRLSRRGDIDAVIDVADRVYRLYGDVIRSARNGAMSHAA
jgi:pyrroloquinoline quinone (PQQ) biosynthesis protein C